MLFFVVYLCVMFKFSAFSLFHITIILFLSCDLYVVCLICPVHTQKDKVLAHHRSTKSCSKYVYVVGSVCVFLFVRESISII